MKNQFDFKKITLILAAIIFLQSCGEEQAIKNVCNKFMQGRIALDNGDSTLIRAVTEDSLFKLLMLHQKYIDILDAPVISPNLNIRVKSVEIKENCADCLMSGMEYYKINLCKHEDGWKVEGENGNYPDAEKIAKARAKLADYKIRLKEKPRVDSVLRSLDVFFAATKEYMKTQDVTSLKSLCTDASVKLIEKLYKYAEKRIGIEALLKEMNAPNYITVSVKFDEDKVSCTFYKEATTLNVQKQGDGYIIYGFYGKDSAEIDQQFIEEEFLNLLRALKLIRSEKYRDKNLVKN